MFVSGNEFRHRKEKSIIYPIKDFYRFPSVNSINHMAPIQSIFSSVSHAAELKQTLKERWKESPLTESIIIYLALKIFYRL
ncbi:hypothetical protein BpHYR1_005771 [Brachionus plicatilis]|uniref:Uncharacterized protein n=1 Tax=Brachionus plicatilis TaxID=10195 RepID=A0A3M7SJ21_BRAPC|nr:hypothetical protein BpHYR1_005771 [Brachionus plicatilis]